MMEDGKWSMKLLLIGPMPNQSERSIGGSTISFGELVRYCEREKILYDVIEVNKFQDRPILNGLYSLIQLIKKVRGSDVVMMNFNSQGFRYLSIPFYIISKISGKKTVFRMFGGDLFEIYRNTSLLHQLILKTTILRSNLVVLQTKFLLEKFSNLGNRLFWYPTSRKAYKIPERKRDFSKRFAFISQIKEEKGVEVVLNVFENLPDEYSIDYYGPVLEDRYRTKMGKNYKGVLEPDAVPNALCNYDFLCFPTFWKGEGYPGIIIEAYSVGVPVIATRWRSIPEIVDDGSTGLLIQPRSTKALREAIVSITDENYHEFCQASAAKFDEFDSEKINARLMSKISNIT